MARRSDGAMAEYTAISPGAAFGAARAAPLAPRASLARRTGVTAFLAAGAACLAALGVAAAFGAACLAAALGAAALGAALAAAAGRAGLAPFLAAAAASATTGTATSNASRTAAVRLIASSRRARPRARTTAP